MRWYLPWPTRASGNALYLTQGRRRVLTPHARAWRKDAINRIKVTLVGGWWVGGRWTSDIDRPLRLSITGYEPDKRRRDADGLIKGVQDAVALALGFDDRRIRRVEAELVARDEWPSTVSGPCLLVELTYLVREEAA